MQKYTPVYQDWVEVHSSASVLFTISGPCNYQVSSFKTGPIGGSLALFHMESGEFILLSGDEDEFSASGQIVESGTYIFSGGIRQVGFPEKESSIGGEYQFDFTLEEESAVATDTKSWDGIKSLHR